MSTLATTSTRRRTIIAVRLALASLIGIALAAQAMPAGAVFPGNNGRIAWATAPRDSGQNYRIVTANPDGTHIKELTDGTTHDSEPSISPDGTKILFKRVVEASKVESIWVMNADGSNKTPIIEFHSLNRQPTWSPDGTKILFNSDRNGGGYQVFIANADGSNPTFVVDGSTPRWVPGTSKISYVSGGVNVWTVNIDGSDPTQVTNENGTTSPYDWAPDGSKIVFDCTDAEGYNSVCTVNADGSNRTDIGAPGVWEHGGSFSPQGDKILFYGYPEATPKNTVLYVANADGSNPVAIGTDLVYYDHSTWGTSPLKVDSTTTTTVPASNTPTTSIAPKAPTPARAATPIQATPRFTG